MMGTGKRWLPLVGRQSVWEECGYRPFPLQRQVHEALDVDLWLPQVLLVAGGERAGKSTVAAMEVAGLLFTPGTDLVYLAGESYENAEPEFNALHEAMLRCDNVESSSQPRQGQWQMKTRSGVEVRSISFARDGADALIATGRAPDMILICEAGLCQWSWFQAAYRRVSEKRGAVLLSGTLKAARPWYSEKFNEFRADNVYNGKSISLPSWSNLAVYPGGRNDPAIKAQEAAHDSITFSEVFGAEPVASGLLVFGRQFHHETHVTRLEYDPDLPIEIAVDPGYAGAYAVEVVQWSSPADVRVIAEFYEQYATWDDARAWVSRLPYAERITRGVADVAIQQHHADRSQFEVWRDTGIYLNGKPISIGDGIQRMRDFLRSPFSGTPRVRFDPSCTGILWEFQRESYQPDQDGQPLKDQPIDRYNHARKALSYWLCWHFGLSDAASRPPPKPGRDIWAPARVKH